MSRSRARSLKAFGYASKRVALHYLELALLIVVPGVALGLPLGTWLGRGFAEFYGSFFRFPVLVFRVEPAVVVLASLVAILAAVLGVFGTVRRVMVLPPIAAMTPEVPAFHGSVLDAAGLSRALSPASRMVLRNIARRPLRTALAVAGMSLAVAVTTIGNSVADAADRMRDVRYQMAERQDMTISLLHARAVGTVQDFLSLPGVRRAEPFRVLGEIAVLAAPAIPAGLTMGYWLSGLVLAATSGERMHMSHIVSTTTYAFAVVVFMIAAVVSALVVRRGLDRLDLVGVLKARE